MNIKYNFPGRKSDENLAHNLDDHFFEKFAQEFGIKR
jgi:hypothetical protein